MLKLKLMLLNIYISMCLLNVIPLRSYDIMTIVKPNHNVITDDYAILNYEVYESGPALLSGYVHWKKEIQCNIPQIYYSNNYSAYDEELEATINKRLLAKCSVGFELPTIPHRQLVEYTTDYEITRADDELISIRFFGYMHIIGRSDSWCSGICFEPSTGKELKLDEFIDMEANLVNLVKNGTFRYSSPADFTKDEVIEILESYFVLHENYNDVDFYIDDNEVNLIIPQEHGNTNYIILSRSLIDKR